MVRHDGTHLPRVLDQRLPRPPRHDVGLELAHDDSVPGGAPEGVHRAARRRQPGAGADARCAGTRQGCLLRSGLSAGGVGPRQSVELGGARRALSRRASRGVAGPDPETAGRRGSARAGGDRGRGPAPATRAQRRRSGRVDLRRAARASGAARALSGRYRHREVDGCIRSRHLAIDRGQRLPDRCVTRGALRGGLALAAVCAAAAIAYAPSFAVPFQFDDFSRLGQNWYLQHGYLVEALLWLGTSRIVPGLTLVLNYQLGGFHPFGFHCLTFAVHLLATVRVFALALTLCSTPRLRETWNPRRARLLAIASALLFT